MLSLRRRLVSLRRSYTRLTGDVLSFHVSRTGRRHLLRHTVPHPRLHQGHERPTGNVWRCFPVIPSFEVYALKSVPGLPEFQERNSLRRAAPSQACKCLPSMAVGIPLCAPPLTGDNQARARRRSGGLAWPRKPAADTNLGRNSVRQV